MPPTSNFLSRPVLVGTAWEPIGCTSSPLLASEAVPPLPLPPIPTPTLADSPNSSLLLVVAVCKLFCSVVGVIAVLLLLLLPISLALSLPKLKTGLNWKSWVCELVDVPPSPPVPPCPVELEVPPLKKPT